MLNTLINVLVKFFVVCFTEVYKRIGGRGNLITSVLFWSLKNPLKQGGKIKLQNMS